MVKPHPASTRFTDPAGTLPGALDFHEIGGASTVLEKLLGVSGTKAVDARLASPEWVDAQLASLPGGALALLEILVDEQGAAGTSRLATLAHERVGLTPEQLETARMLTTRAGLSMDIALRDYAGAQRGQVVLLSQNAAIVASRVRGLSLPRGTPPDDAVVRPTHQLRDHVARLSATAHFAIRATSGGAANRTSLKKLAIAVGMDPDGFARVTDDALRDGALGEREGMILPRVDVLRGVARGEAGTSTLDRWALDHVPSDVWVSVDALVRARESAERRLDHTRPPGWYDFREPPFEGGRRIDSGAALRSSPSLSAVEHEGAWFVRRPKRGTGGDGHVTPSFEVMLGPACDPELALTIALAAEPVRFDKVLTLKLTPSSISAGASLGLDGDAVIAALDAVGRHPVPANVRAMVRDWAKGARRVTLRKAWVVEASSAEAADVAARALGNRVVARPSPTTLVVDESLASPAAVLAKAGVTTDGAVPVSNLAMMSASSGPRVPVAFVQPSPKAELVARFDADRAAHTLVPNIEFDVAREGPGAELRALARKQPASAKNIRTFIERVAKLWNAAIDEYLAWVNQLAPDDHAPSRALVSMAPLWLLPWIVRTPAVRRRLLRANRDVMRLAAESERQAPTTLTLDGSFALGMLSTHPEVLAFLRSEVERTFGTMEPDVDDEPSPPRSPPTKLPPAAATGPGARPRPADLPEQHGREILATLTDLVTSQKEAWVRVRSKSQGDRVVRFRVERLLTRGLETTVLGTDLDEDLGRSFPLGNIVAVRVALGEM